MGWSTVPPVVTPKNATPEPAACVRRGVNRIPVVTPKTQSTNLPHQKRKPRPLSATDPRDPGSHLLAQQENVFVPSCLCGQ